MKKIIYSPALKLSNIGGLQRPPRARYLECSEDQSGRLIAKSWWEREPKAFQILVCFGI
jgi:hypothetical protein